MGSPRIAGSRAMSFAEPTSSSSGTPIQVPHGFSPFVSDRRHSFSNSDFHRMSMVSERSASFDASWEPGWGERPRSSVAYFPPTPGEGGEQTELELEASFPPMPKPPQPISMTRYQPAVETESVATRPPSAYAPAGWDYPCM